MNLGKGRPKRRKHGSDPRYAGTLWRKYRKAYLSRHPLCVECGAVAEVVDHVKPVRLYPHIEFMDESNHAALCHSCHNSKRGKESHIPVSYDR